MGIVGIGVLGTLAMLAFRGNSDHMALLYADVDLRESAQMVDELNRQHIPYQVGAQGAQIMVPGEQVAQARMLLAKQGLPSGGSIGYEIFDRGDGLTTNQFEQTINQTRALEGELARSIRSIQGVKAARVHLVLPKREPFARDRQDAQASIMLGMAGANRLDHEAILAIQNLVAAAVPGLRPQAISIVDNHGELLARPADADGSVSSAVTIEELRRKTEQSMERNVEEMLERSLGPGRVRAEAAVDMDFDRVSETKETFDPDGQVVRSTQTSNDSSKNTEAAAPTTVQNNLPNNTNTDSSTTGSQQQRQQETTNYEIGKTTRNVVHDQPQIRRISLAVMVDGVVEPGADGKPAWRERTPDELARITALVKSAIGFDEKRQDHVEVVNLRFAPIDAEIAATPTMILGVSLEKADLIRLAETAMLGLVALAALFLVLRPMAYRIMALQHSEFSEQDADMLAAPGLAAISPAAAAGMALAGGAGPASALLQDETMVQMANIEGQIRASSLRRVADLAAQHPEETLAIIRRWMTEGAE